MKEISISEKVRRLIKSGVTDVEKSRLIRDVIKEHWNVKAEACRIFKKRWASIDEESEAMVPVTRIVINEALGVLLDNDVPDDDEWKDLLNVLKDWRPS